MGNLLEFIFFWVFIMWTWYELKPTVREIFNVVLLDYHQKSYEEGLEDGKKIGHTQALEKVEQTKLENQIDYRSAARYLKKTCAFCGKSCIHCSKKKEEEIVL